MTVVLSLSDNLSQFTLPRRTMPQSRSYQWRHSLPLVVERHDELNNLEGTPILVDLDGQSLGFECCCCNRRVELDMPLLLLLRDDTPLV